MGPGAADRGKIPRAKNHDIVALNQLRAKHA